MAQSQNKVTFNDNMKLKPNSKNKEYICLSNQYVCNIVIDEKQYNHIEGFYYASRFIGNNEKVAERIRSVLFPGLCKKIANEYPLSEEQVNKWKSREILLMKRALFVKFISNGELAKILLSTGDAILIYDKSDDNYWGNGSDNKGQNILGKLLEEVRDVLNDLPTISTDDDSDTDNEGKDDEVEVSIANKA